MVLVMKGYLDLTKSRKRVCDTGNSFEGYAIRVLHPPLNRNARPKALGEHKFIDQDNLIWTPDYPAMHKFQQMLCVQMYTCILKPGHEPRMLCKPVCACLRLHFCRMMCLDEPGLGAARAPCTSTA